MHHPDATIPGFRTRRRARLAVEALGLLGLCGVVALSAVITKEAQSRAALDPLVAVNVARTTPTDTALDLKPEIVLPIEDPGPMPAETASPAAAVADLAQSAQPAAPALVDPEIRFFNGRPVRPAKTMWMTVTAYSPDERSCGDSADGITSSIHSVWTNAMRLVAADTRILPLGSMITVPGYDEGNIVPVLDRGGAIKGHRLDVLYPTHAIARVWGVQRLKVTVWEYADGKPADNFRAIRDSKN